MLKKVLLCSFLLLTTVSFSQIGVKGGFALGQPIGDNAGKFHAGFDVGVTYNITDNFRAEVLLEGLFRNENQGFFTLKSTLLPITVGADYGFGDWDIKPYVGINLGSYTASAKMGEYKPESRTYFGFYPKVGANYAFTDHLLLDIAFKYHMYFLNNNGNGKNMNMLFGANVGINYIF